MQTFREGERSVERLYLAGERVPPGLYRQVGGNRELRLEQEDYLPASLDGRVACFMRIEYTWEQVSNRELSEHTFRR